MVSITILLIIGLSLLPMFLWIVMSNIQQLVESIFVVFSVLLQNHVLGEDTDATPDGRKAGES